MANRHLARSLVLQTLFEADAATVPDAMVPEILERNTHEFGGEDTDQPFMETLLLGILSKRADLDKIIVKAAPEWPIEKIAPVDRNILRMGLYELLFADRAQVPPKVAINEAIELAKIFGGESSPRFVNGVLGAVYKSMGSPGREDAGKRDRTTHEDLPVEHLAGAVVYALHEGQTYVALVHDVFGHWTLSKGHVDGEPEEEVAKVISEELGLEGQVRGKIGENEYVASHPEKGKVRKHVHFFLVETPFGHLALKRSGGLDDARWFKLSDIIGLNFYEDMRPIITAAVQDLLDRSRVRA